MNTNQVLFMQKMSYQMMNVQSAGQLILIIEVSIFTMNAVFFE